MSTLKAKTIQPVSDSDTLVLRTGASDSLTLDTNGNATIRGELTVDGIPIGQGPLNTDTNTRVGFNTFTAISSGTWNTALGKSALSVTNTGYYNTAVGGQALRDNTQGIENTAVGLNSGVNNTTGNYNTAIGSQSGPASGSQEFVTCIGRGAVAASLVSNSVALGASSNALTSNSIYLGNSQTTSLYMGNGSGVTPAFVARAWAQLTGNGSSVPTITANGNISGISKTSTGLYAVTFSTQMPSANYAVMASADNNGEGSGVAFVRYNTRTTTGFSFSHCDIGTHATKDLPAGLGYYFVVFG